MTERVGSKSRSARPMAAALLIAGAFVAVVLLYAVNSSSDRAASAEDLARQNRDIILRFCLETNERHDNTIRRLDRIIAELPAGPEKVRARRNRASTVLIIEALAPKRDCQAFASGSPSPASSARSQSPRIPARAYAYDVGRHPASEGTP
jgi:hypothetical protein